MKTLFFIFVGFPYGFSHFWSGSSLVALFLGFSSKVFQVRASQRPTKKGCWEARTSKTLERTNKKTKKTKSQILLASFVFFVFPQVFHTFGKVQLCFCGFSLWFLRFGFPSAASSVNLPVSALHHSPPPPPLLHPGQGPVADWKQPTGFAIFSKFCIFQIFSNIFSNIVYHFYNFQYFSSFCNIFQYFPIISDLFK